MRICYQIFVRSFADSNGDGIGDLQGIIKSLPYLKELGVEGLWLTPIFKSPSYHKYDCTDYYQVDPEYGTEEDLIMLCQQAKRFGIEIILDLVLNHTSDRHPWFRNAARNAESPYRDFYYWKTPTAIKQAGIGQRAATEDSGEKYPWHWPKNKSSHKYYGMFWSGMPDLNLDTPALRQELVQIAKYWLQRGVSGFRLDAAKHLFPSWEPVEKTLNYWKEFRNALEQDFPKVYLVGEVWDAPEKVAPFFEFFDANFNIDLSFQIKRLLKGQISKGLFEAFLKQTYQVYQLRRTDFIDAILLNNHDQDRIGSVLQNDPAKLKLAAKILFTLPGQVYLYYGEELGMLGAKPDEHIREPFPWHDERKTTWLKAKYQAPASPNQQDQDSEAMLRFYKMLIGLRLSVPALATILPNFEIVQEVSLEVLVFVRKHAEGDVLVLINLSDQKQQILLTESLQCFRRPIYMEGTEMMIDPYGLMIFGS